MERIFSVAFGLVLVLGQAGPGVHAQQADPLAALSLAEAERLMLAHNRELRAARRTQEVARTDTQIAGQPPNPTLSVQTVNINPKLGVGGGALRDKTVDTTLRIDQVIERGDKRELRVQTARTLETAIDADYADALRQQRLALRGAYYDLMLAQEKSSVLADTAALFERSIEAAERRLKAGDIAATDLARLRVDALRAKNDARSVEAERTRAQLSLAYMVGAEGAAQGIRADDPWPQPAAMAMAGGFDSGLIERRPDVRAAQARVQAAESARELARRQRTRDISVGVQYEHFPTGPTDGAGNSYGVGISIPLFVRHAFEGEVRRAELDLDTARDNLEKVRALATGELGRAWSDLQSAAERLRRYNDTLLAEAGRAAEGAEYAFKNGALGIMDLLDSRRTLRAIQIDAATAQADYAKALAVWNASAIRTE